MPFEEFEEPEIDSLKKGPPALRSLRIAAYNTFGVHLNGARNWFLLFMLTLLGIGILGILFPVVPLILAAKILGAVFLTASLVISAKALLVDYEAVKKSFVKDQKLAVDSFSPLTYIQKVVGTWLGKSWRNKVQLAFGILLFVSVALAVAFFAFPGIGAVVPFLNPVFDSLTTVVAFLGQGFSVSMVVSPLAVSVFMAAAVLTAYDVLCRLINWVVPIEEKKVQKLTVQEDSALVGFDSDVSEKEEERLQHKKKTPNPKGIPNQDVTRTSVDSTSVISPPQVSSSADSTPVVLQQPQSNPTTW
jgi:hypothetical protein